VKWKLNFEQIKESYVYVTGVLWIQSLRQGICKQKINQFS